MALDLAQMLEGFERGYFPLEKDAEDADPFDSDNAYHCKAAMEMILDTLRRGSLFRVTFGMLVVCDPRNEMIDPNLSYLEHHPDAKWAREQREGLLDALRDAFGHVDRDTHCNTHAQIESVLKREAAYGLFRYLAGGGWLPFTRGPQA